MATTRRDACIVAAGTFGKHRVLLKNRDRNYIPKVKLVREIRDGMEVAYLLDEKTGWVEGMNANGIGIVNSALMVSRDESERDEVERTGKKLCDGDRILRALEEKTVAGAAKSIRTYKGGLKGHTLVADGERTIHVEMPDSNDEDYDDVPTSKLFVRTNHGVEFPDAGYVEGPREESSKSRQEEAEEVLAKVSSPEEVAPALLRARDDRWEPTEMVRDNRSNRRMRTTTQMVLDLTARKLMLYLLPGRVEFLGIEDKLPKDFEPEIKVEIREYEDLSQDTKAQTKPITKKAVWSPDVIVRGLAQPENQFNLAVALHQQKQDTASDSDEWVIWWWDEEEQDFGLVVGIPFPKDPEVTLANEVAARTADGKTSGRSGPWGGREAFFWSSKTKAVRAAKAIVAALLQHRATNRTAATVVLDATLVGRFRKDILQLAKAAESARDLKDARIVRDAVLRWAEHFSRFGDGVREELQTRLREAETYETTGRLPYGGRVPADKGWAKYYIDHGDAMWALDSESRRVPEVPEPRSQYGGSFEEPEVTQARLLEFYLKDYRDPEVARAQLDSYLDRSPLWTRTDAEAAALQIWKNEVAKWTRRLREKGRLAWKYLDDLTRWAGRGSASLGGGAEVKVTMPEDERVELEGFRLLFRGYDDGSEHTREYLPAVRAGLRAYRQHASKVLPLLLQKQLPMVIEWVEDSGRGGDAAASYEGRYIRVTPWAINDKIDRFVHVLAHEMGHHLYKTVLSSEEQSFWSTAVRQDYGDLDLRDALKTLERFGSQSGFLDKNLADADPVLFLQLGTLVSDIAYKHKDLIDAASIRRYLEAGGDPMVRVPKHPITWYAGKNAEEAFCETIGRLVAYGPLVLPAEVLRWLRQVMPSVRIANAVVELESSWDFPEFRVGDLIFYGKFQNKTGQVARLFVENGIPMVEIAPVGHARRKNRIVSLFRVRHTDPAKRVASAWLRASTWAYHGTMSERLPWIQRYGLVPNAAPRLRRYNESGLFFSDQAEFSQGYGGADVLLRFPFPRDARPDTHPVSGRLLPHSFISQETVPVRHIEMLMGSEWVPL